MNLRRKQIVLALACINWAALATAESPKLDTSRGDQMIANYFRNETEKLAGRNLKDIQSLDDWNAKRPVLHKQLLEMLGLDPMPERTELQATITRKIERDEFVVENLHFQSSPGLYVTGNLYLPREVKERLPAILYVCGHGAVKKDGVSYGNKVHYHRHGAWFARNGYVCLVIDTVQLGEIEGIHHGTYRENMWWWLNRGYTPAGVEAWNCIRALDYLQSRKEVDPQRLGVTGRSGGGAYSWWIAAIDDRIKCAVPVAGITDMRNHVYDGGPGRYQDGCVEGHCDCMYMLNTHRWDYAQVAALVAPRPLLISNTDSDSIFPLDGVYRVFKDARAVYRLHDAANRIALNVTPGGHQDTQELRVNAFRWFNQHLKNDDGPIEKLAKDFLEPEQLKVFDELPNDQRNSNIHESFVPTANITLPNNAMEWQVSRDAWMKALREKCFAAWPAESEPLEAKEVFRAVHQSVELRAIDFTSQEGIRLRLYIAHYPGLENPDLVVLNTLDAKGWTEFLAMMRPGFEKELANETLPEPDEKAFQQTRGMFRSFKWAMAYVAPRGIGPTAWNQSEKKLTQHRRRFYLLGQTLDGMRVFDLRRSIQALKAANGMKDVPVWLQAEGRMAGISLYASLFEPEIARLDLHSLPRSHRQGPFFLNVRRYFDVPQAVAMAVERSRVIVYQEKDAEWEYPTNVAKQLKWDNVPQVRTIPAEPKED